MASIVLTAVVAMGGLAFGVTSNQDMSGPASYTPDTSISMPLVPSPEQTLAASTASLKALHAEQMKVWRSKPVLARVPAADTTRTYRIHPGDSLSKIAKSMYGDAYDWPVIYWANTKTIKYADIIETGWNLTIPPATRYIPNPPQEMAPPAPVAPVPASAPVTVVAAVQSVPSSTYVPPAQPATYSGSGSMQSCIISRESGGNPNIWNASGHWGLYQFSYDTWVAHGGSGGSFGNASVSEQNQIYYNTVAADGYSDWSPYDGC